MSDTWHVWHVCVVWYAGERALQCLPSCLALLEGCLEVIANQAACLEELADIDSTLLEQRVLKQQAAAAAGAAAAGTGSSRQGSAGMELDLGSKGARQVSWQDLLPVLSPAQVEQLLERMGQVTQVSGNLRTESIRHGVVLFP